MNLSSRANARDLLLLLSLAAGNARSGARKPANVSTYGYPVRLVSVDPTTPTGRTTRDGRRGLLALARALPAAWVRTVPMPCIAMRRIGTMHPAQRSGA